MLEVVLVDSLMRAQKETEKETGESKQDTALSKQRNFVTHNIRGIIENIHRFQNRDTVTV